MSKSGWNITDNSQLELFIEHYVVLYARVSTGKAEADTIENQFEELRRWCLENQFGVLGTFWDKCSGRKGSEVREGLSKAIETANASGASVLCVELSRLSRSVKHTAEMLEGNTKFIFTRDGVQMTKEMLLVKSLFAQMESEAISRRVKAGIQNKFKTDPNARSEWGKARHKESTLLAMETAKKQKANEHTLKVGKVATEMRESGSTLREIVATYEDLGVLTSRGKSKWSAKTISDLIARYKALKME